MITQTTTVREPAPGGVLFAARETVGASSQGGQSWPIVVVSVHRDFRRPGSLNEREFARQAVDVLKKRMKWRLRAWRLASLCEKLLSVGRHDWSVDGIAFDDRRSSICLPGAVSMRGKARLNPIPKGMLPVYESIVGLTDDVCDRRLNSEYRDLARAMTGALCRKHQPSRQELSRRARADHRPETVPSGSDLEFVPAESSG